MKGCLWGPATDLSGFGPTTSPSRVTDHQINLTLYRLDEMMDGGCQMIIDPLVQEHQAELLASLDKGSWRSRKYGTRIVSGS